MKGSIIRSLRDNLSHSAFPLEVLQEHRFDENDSASTVYYDDAYDRIVSVWPSRLEGYVYH